MYRTEPFTPAKFTSEGTMELRGQIIKYNTVCEDNVFYSDDGKPVATIFSYSYFRSDVEDVKSRPVLFGFNGGPGSSSEMVHAGFLGAKRMKYTDDVDDPTTLPPYEIIDNPDCFLDIADVVLVDPVNTGFGLLLDESQGNKFFGIEEDAEALLVFISQWLTRYGRWGSPKYLIGESYGCTRSAVAAGMACGTGAERTYSFSFDGVVLIGNTVTVGKYFNREVAVEPSVFALPTYAAINWYHNHPSDQTVEEFVAEAKQFADTEYLMALYKGDDLQGEELEGFLDKLVYYSGHSREYLKEHFYRFDRESGRTEITRDKGFEVSRYDGRITLPSNKPRITNQNKEPFRMLDEPVSSKYGPYFHSALLDGLCPALNINFNRIFVDSFYTWKKWNNETKDMSTADYLSHAMHRSPGMRTFFANGWYDMCTQVGIIYYTMSHAGLPRDRVFLKGYKSGHMIYIGEDNIKELCDDIRGFIQGENPKQ